MSYKLFLAKKENLRIMANKAIANLNKRRGRKSKLYKDLVAIASDADMINRLKYTEFAELEYNVRFWI